MTGTGLSLSLLTTLAWRNLWRQRRRTAVMLVAIALGVWSMVTLAALYRGLFEQQLRSAILNLTGHIQIHAPKYRDDPTIEHSMPAPDAILLAALNQPDIDAWAPRVRVPGVISSERESAGITLIGIDPSAEHGLSFIPTAVTSGRYLDSTGDNGLLLGRELAARLETGVGKRVVVMSQDADNQIADRGFRVAGIFDAEGESEETAYVFTGLHVAQAMLKLDSKISEIAVMTPDRDHLAVQLARLRAAAPGFEVEPWTVVQPLLVLTVRISEIMMYIWFAVVFLAMSFGLVNTLLMAVFERTREIGLFQALGMKPGFITIQVLVESVMLLAVGLLVGNAASWASIAWLHDGIDLSRFAKGMEMVGYGTHLFPYVAARDVVTANLLVIVLGIVASLYPAYRASRYVPVEAITRT